MQRKRAVFCLWLIACAGMQQEQAETSFSQMHAATHASTPNLTKTWPVALPPLSCVCLSACLSACLCLCSCLLLLPSVSVRVSLALCALVSCAHALSRSLARSLYVCVFVCVRESKCAYLIAHPWRVLHSVTMLCIQSKAKSSTSLQHADIGNDNLPHSRVPNVFHL